MNRKFIFNSNYILNNVLNKKENIDILQDFIETILEIKVKQIYYRRDLYDENINREYFGISNVIVVTDENKKLNIGIQIIDGFFIQYKMILYYAQTFIDSVETITINLLDLEYLDRKEYQKDIKINKLDTENIKKKNLGEIHLIELPKLNDGKINSKKDAWISYLKNGKLDNESKEKYEKIEKLDKVLDDFWEKEIM